MVLFVITVVLCPYALSVGIRVELESVDEWSMTLASPGKDVSTTKKRGGGGELHLLNAFSVLLSFASLSKIVGGWRLC